ncbi:unnamed protein product [Periconia digitata]|uniref:Rhodopsin domain-containing protein n=1 Tax=Periconia digitata TaxID=1303443 RepID=A0A9W4XEY0_9PLEO|nr:unnamed protein product [Periconia digitata]
MMVILALNGVATIIACALICQPVAYNWDRTIPGGKCGNYHAFWLITSILGVIFDLILIVLPLPVFWKLQLSLRKKITLTILFGLGFFIFAITIMRVIYIEKINYEDLTYTGSLLTAFTVLEPTLGIVAGCVPIMSPSISRVKIILKTAFVSMFKGSSSTIEHSTTTPLGFSKEAFPDEHHWSRLHDRLYPLTDITSSQITTVDARLAENDELWGVE